MRQRGRPSKEQAEVRVISGNFGGRPEPAADLTEEEAMIWRATVASEPADFFSTAALKALLTDYCRHRASADKATRVINLFQDDWLRNEDGAKRYHGLLKIRECETKAAASMATKLRMTNQSRYTPMAAGTAARNMAKGVMPWEDL